MSVKFLSNEWYNAMVEALKKEFSRPEGLDLTFCQVVEETSDGVDRWMNMELKDSVLVSYTMGEGDDLPDAQFKAFASYETFRKVINGELDGSVGLSTGEFGLEGNMAKALTLMGTYNRLEAVQRSIQTEF